MPFCFSGDFQIAGLVIRASLRRLHGPPSAVIAEAILCAIAIAHCSRRHIIFYQSPNVLGHCDAVMIRNSFYELTHIVVQTKLYGLLLRVRCWTAKVVHRASFRGTKQEAVGAGKGKLYLGRIRPDPRPGPFLPAA